MHPLVGHGVARGALALYTTTHASILEQHFVSLLVAKQHSSGGCELACSIFYAQCLFLG